MALRELIADRIRTSGPISFAEFMDISLYHPELGYYARAAQKTGRAGDFFTSVDVGPIFGELLANSCRNVRFCETGRGIFRRTGKYTGPVSDLEAGAAWTASPRCVDAAKRTIPSLLRNRL